MKKNNLIYVVCIWISLSIIVYGQDTNIVREDVINSQKLIGIEFTDAEIDSMTENLSDFLASYKTIRELKLSNSVPPAILFNPIPIDFQSQYNKSALIVSDYSYTKMPENKDDLAYYSIGELAYLIRTKQIASIELTQFFIDRLKKYDPILECVITLTEDLALKQAAKADKELEAGQYRGLLHGIPYGAKDLLSVKGYKTTWGAAPYKNQIIVEDATVIKKMEEAGSVLVAKLTLGALAWGDVWYGGKTKNPWDVSSGSSGSSA
ncbi:MAG: amidase family protein, partial [Melioribacteraceae bacterium]|nr:amidase family protein [Melioribacteraceae bacterium]